MSATRRDVAAPRWAHRVAAAVALVAVLLAGIAQAQPATPEPVIARVTITLSSDLVRFMALGLDVVEARDGDDLFIVTTIAELYRLRADGWTISLDIEHTARLRQQQEEQRQRRLAPGLPGTESFMGGYRTASEIRAFVDDRAARYPGLAAVFVYGDSWERVTGGPTAGHDLFGISLTNMQRPAPKPTLFLMAAIHARELSTAELGLRFIDHLLDNYGTDGDVTWLLDEHLIVVVPVVNPDGHVLAEQGYLQRKNTDTSHGNCTVPNIGVDLNRNSTFKWGTVDTPTESPCSQTYPGPIPLSEPETAALQTLVRSLFPDQRGPNDSDASPITTTGILLTLHSYGDLVMWPWGWTSTPAPNAADLAAVGRKLAGYNGYTPQQSIQLYPTSGTTDDWAYGELGIAAFTFEVGPSGGACGGFFPPLSCLDGGSGGSFWPRNLPAFLYAARIARAPFDLVRGPTAEAATASVLADGRVLLQMRLDAQTNGSQPIAAAEYYLDTPPWSGGTPVAMTPADGSFDGTVEVASAVLEPLADRRLIFARGRSSSGAWGPVRAVFTPAPGCTAVLSPASRSVAAEGGSGTVAVTLPSGCAWIASTVATWITITDGSTGTGPGSVSYSIAPNPSATPRSGVIAIGGQSFMVSEDGQLPPDLRVSAVSPPPAAAIPGTSFSVTDTTENAGGGNASASTTRFYLSGDASKGGADTLMSGSRSVPALGPGATSTGTITITIPSSTALGSYFLLACADDAGIVGESDEGNNCLTAGAMIRVTRPDLAETWLSNPPPIVAPGHSFSTTDTVTNRGAVASGASTTRYYLSVDQQKASGDKLLSGSRSVPSLAAGATSTNTVSVTVPTSTALGTYYLIACADDTTMVAEVSETNNCLASASQVQVTRPDLVETAVSDPPSSAAPGSGFPVTDTVMNRGAVASSPSTTRYYLSADQQKGTGDKLLSGSRAVPGLAPGATSTNMATVTVPTSTALGTYYLIACADDTHAVSESSEVNNCLASSGRVRVTRPDLAQTAVSSPPSGAAPGSRFSVTDTVTNQGAVGSGPSTTRYYLSVDQQRGTGDKLLTGSRSVPALAAGYFSSGTVDVTIPAATTPGTYHVLACADDTSVVPETNEGNNCLASTGQLTVGP